MYFREIRIIGANNIPVEGAVIFTANHQNAFLDALLIATTNGRLTNFLVRADIFKSGLAKRFFYSLKMMPIYRWRDGRHGLFNNQEIFARCHQILSDHEALLLFPEANHHQLRRLLPLSKGFTRITAGIDQKANPVKIVPVGLNYTHHRSLGGSVAIIYGPALVPPIEEETRAYVALLRNQVSERMQQLITHIGDSSNYQMLVHHLNGNPWDYLDPHKCNKWVKENQDVILHHSGKPQKKNIVGKTIRALALLINFLPMAFCRYLLYKIKDPVFTSSIKVLTALFIFPIYYTLSTLLIVWWLGPVWGFTFLIVSAGSMWLRKWSVRLRN